VTWRGARLGLLLALVACQARPPGRLERAAATFVKHHLTVRGRRDRNPVPDTPELAARGREAFSHACAACHGADGRLGEVPFAGAMSPPVPSLASAEVQDYSDGQLHWVIQNGLWPSGMPAARDLLSDEEIWRIVRWLRRLPAARTGADEAAGQAGR
jgi:mono/diheme cytochrome c family protein